MDDERGGLTEVLGVVVTDRRLAVRLTDLREVLPGRRLTRIPQAPPGLLGMMSARGELVTVFELLVDASASAGPDHPRWVVVVDGSRAPLAFAVDEVTGTASIDPGALHEPHTAGAQDQSPVEGLTADGVGLIDVERLAGDRRFWPYAPEHATGTEIR
ncbi:MAG: chemotaxis protein CheW [Actinobacteria bacterium]|nr:chemotaxis protein CheW [Actinomycetota bacterium]